MSVWTHNVICQPNEDGHDPLAVKAEDSIAYGTHTLPKTFWTSGATGLLRGTEFRARLLSKSIRTVKNKEARADANRNRGSLKGR